MVVQSDLNGKVDQVAADLSGMIERLDRKIEVGLRNVFW